MASPFTASKYFLAVVLLLLLASPPCHAGANITAILEGHPELGEFSSLLVSTGVADDIMARADTMTVLAVHNDDMGPLRPMPREAIREHLSLHVLLVYNDEEMLGRLRPGESADLPTLFQPSSDEPKGVGMVTVFGPTLYPFVHERVSFMPKGPAEGAGFWTHALFVKTVHEDPGMVVLQVSAPMSAPWLPGASARRDAAGGDAAPVDATGGGGGTPAAAADAAGGGAKKY